MNKKEELQKLWRIVSKCQKCSLAKTRTNVVLGDGNIDSSILLVGEGPGRQEDLSGKAFFGPAGQLLDR